MILIFWRVSIIDFKSKRHFRRIDACFDAADLVRSRFFWCSWLPAPSSDRQAIPNLAPRSGCVWRGEKLRLKIRLMSVMSDITIGLAVYILSHAINACTVLERKANHQAPQVSRRRLKAQALQYCPRAWMLFAYASVWFQQFSCHGTPHDGEAANDSRWKVLGKSQLVDPRISGSSTVCSMIGICKTSGLNPFCWEVWFDSCCKLIGSVIKSRFGYCSCLRRFSTKVQPYLDVVAVEMQCHQRR